MKKITIFASFLFLICTGCKNNETKNTPAFIEGEVENVKPAADRNQSDFIVAITDSSGKNMTVFVNQKTGLQLLSSMTEKTKRWHNYVRLQLSEDSVYTLKEQAQLNYDKGTPPVFEFPSDKKVAGYYK